ncbi:hypothetical protein [Streptomyces poriferorum]|uniref:Uncharacterized protein n=1 Tax=Streptomyces poriferorum TaxID=2798799 RepID=A0ABY9J265_9ACTN|nr:MULTISPECIES: hypothetical protein [unclassified Streptomyces]MDP5310442.1 hypothetical protein [Streptomyces sp. Alt4]WLQ60404.1 hypothetical protein P8A19_35495 [Streptomyces sp. Alt2]
MTDPTPAQLHHLANRARDGVALPAEHDQLAAGITAMAARLAEYENAINWHTTCTSCARILDSAYAETVRAEQAEAERDRYRLAWQSACARVKRTKRNGDSHLRHANAMWSNALRDLHRYRQAWQSARHRAAMYLKSNRNLAASLDNGHAAYRQLYAALDQAQQPTTTEAATASATKRLAFVASQEHLCDEGACHHREHPSPYTA